MIRVSRSGQNFGPYSIEMARAYLHTGHIQGDDLVWSEEGNTWIPVHDHPLLKDFQPPPPPLKSLPAASTHRIVGGWLLFLCILLTIANPLGNVAVMIVIWSQYSMMSDRPQFGSLDNAGFREIWDKYQELQVTHPELLQGMTLSDFAKHLNEQTKSGAFNAGLDPTPIKYAIANAERFLDSTGITDVTRHIFGKGPIWFSLFLAVSSFYFFKTGLNLWKRDPTAVKKAKYFMVFMGAFPILAILVIQMDSLPGNIRDYLTTGMASQIIPQILWSTVWYLYLVHSKRVTETFHPLKLAA